MSKAYSVLYEMSFGAKNYVTSALTKYLLKTSFEFISVAETNGACDDPEKIKFSRCLASILYTLAGIPSPSSFFLPPTSAMP